MIHVLLFKSASVNKKGLYLEKVEPHNVNLERGKGIVIIRGTSILPFRPLD